MTRADPTVTPPKPYLIDRQGNAAGRCSGSTPIPPSTRQQTESPQEPRAAAAASGTGEEPRRRLQRHPASAVFPRCPNSAEDVH
ncbi:hypothetical protein B0I35DRAFT_122703 [Stachybotrys elegans]|uniref:Uncharacterized protein n=1 Tax=Stachybotrys elegans TaxID=80388 RepID=A0A8K0WWK0_9HYPO|nr:hypothetical protein B0I35DRAFT_122703 [Stachybotrys elegans]